MIEKGKNVKLYYKLSQESDELVLALSKSIVVNFKREMIETCTPTTGTGKDFVSGREAWTIKCTGLVAVNCDTFESIANMRDKFSIRTKIGKNTYSGSAIVSNYSITGNVGNLTTYTMTIQGSGTLTITPDEDDDDDDE